MDQQKPSPQRTKCEVWTRVMGYHRPVSQFNKGKKSEFYSRVYYKEQHPNKVFIKKYGTIPQPIAPCLK